MKRILIAAAAALALSASQAQEPKAPVRLAIIGLVHDHAGGFIPKLAGRKDIRLVGIVEPDHDLAARYAASFHLEAGLFHDTLDDLLAHTNVEAVALFTCPFDHPGIVELCAPHGLAIMMEKPLAVNMQGAVAIATASEKYHVPVIVNYQSTWNPAHQAIYDIVHEPGGIGSVRRMICCYGHRGPKEIGCSEDFLKWLTDPKLNGGGALVDFGCYGANLMTWMMDGRPPLAVSAVTLHTKPDVYPKVDDDATIVLTYPNAVGVIQASWNWPYSRGDFEVYGQSGYVLARGQNSLRLRADEGKEIEKPAKPLEGPAADELSYLVAVTRREIQPSGPSSLKFNLMVTLILDAARESALTGRRVELGRGFAH
jgi:predicted dehydrogenase